MKRTSRCRFWWFAITSLSFIHMSLYGGYSCKCLKPLALALLCARIDSEFSKIYHFLFNRKMESDVYGCLLPRILFTINMRQVYSLLPRWKLLQVRGSLTVIRKAFCNSKSIRSLEESKGRLSAHLMFSAKQRRTMPRSGRPSPSTRNKTLG